MLDEDMFEEKWLKQTDFQKVGKKSNINIIKEMPTLKRRFNETKDSVKVNLEKDIEMECPDESEHTMFSDFKLSPHKRCHLSNKGMTKTFKKRKLDTPAANRLEPWMRECNKQFEQIFSLNPWGRKEFIALTDSSLRGTDLYLTDNHLDWASALIKHKFSDLHGLNSPLLYEIFGFPPLDSDKKFIQLSYAGGPHWVTISNCQIPRQKRNVEVELYDSLLQLEKGSKIMYEINPAIVWQSAQLLRRKDQEGQTPWSIFITVKPCHQQWPNMTECGLYAIANAFTLAFNKKPENLQYTGNMREEFMSKVKSLETSMFSCVDENRDASKFKVISRVGNVLDSVPLKKMTKKFDLLCHCQLPLTYGDLVTCDLCNYEFHAKCYMFTIEAVKEWKEFYCYNCRQPGHYSFLQVKVQPDTDAIDSFIKKFEKQKTFRFGRFMHSVRRFHKKQLVSTKGQLQRLFEIYVKYDLNLACQKSGRIYNTFYNLYHNMQSELPNKYPIEMLTRSQIIHFLILLICDLDNLDCPPLHYAQMNTQGKSQYENVHKSQKDWLAKLLALSSVIATKVEKFCSVKHDISDIFDFISTYNKEVNDMETYGVELLKLYADSSSAQDFPKQFEAEKEHVLKDIETICSTAQDCIITLKQYQDDMFS
jgi:hypothetical protein